MFLAYPICRYADADTMHELLKRAPKWRNSSSGNNVPALLTFRKHTAKGAPPLLQQFTALFAVSFLHAVSQFHRIKASSPLKTMLPVL